MLKPYLFLVRSFHSRARTKGVRVIAKNFKLAKSKVLARYPGKKVNSKFAINMDLISAKVEAAKVSKDERKTVYINVDKEGECYLSTKQNGTTQSVFKNGNEGTFEEITNDVAPAELAKEDKVKTSKKLTTVESVKEAPKTVKKLSSEKIKNQKVMSTVKTATKKVAAPTKKATPVKKLAAKTTAVKKPVPAKVLKPTPSGKTMLVKEIKAAIKKGLKVVNHAGVRFTPKYIDKMADQDRAIVASLVKE